MPKIAIPRLGKDAVCEDCDLVYPLDADGEPVTQAPYTCDDCGGAVEAIEGDALADKPFVQPTGKDGNAFAIMGACSQAARKAGWEKTRIDAVMAEMMAGDYSHLLRTAMTHFDVA